MLKINKNVPSPLLSAFAQSFDLRLIKDDAEDFITKGSAGSVCDFGDSKHLLLHYHTEGITYGWRRRMWDNLRTKAVAAGFVLTMNGDFEGCLKFLPGNQKQAQIAAEATIR